MLRLVEPLGGGMLAQLSITRAILRYQVSTVSTAGSLRSIGFPERTPCLSDGLGFRSPQVLSSQCLVLSSLPHRTPDLTAFKFRSPCSLFQLTGEVFAGTALYTNASSS